MADIAFNSDLALMFLDDVVGNAEPQPGALADILCGKNGSKIFSSFSTGMPLPVV